MIKAYSLRKDDPIVLSNYAYALFKMGAVTNSMMQVEEAVDKFKMAVSQFPKSAVVFATYGHVRKCVTVAVLYFCCCYCC